MGPKKGRRARKREIPTDTPTEFELGGHGGKYTVKEDGEGGKREEDAQKQREEARRKETTHSAGRNGQKACKDRQK